MKYCHSKEDVGSEPHYAVVVFTSVHIPGDERSRTNPGHGYPAENKPIAEYISFKDADELKQWIGENGGISRSVVIHSTPKKVERKTTVHLEIEK